MKKDQIIPAVQAATSDVFSTMLGVHVTPAEPRTDSTCPSVDDGVMAFVGIAGTWTGNGIISCSASFACRLCELFLMTEAPAVNEEVIDTVGELANMVVGNFKTSAESLVGPLGLTVPTVIYGRNFTSRSVGTKEWIVLPFKAGADHFEVRIWFAPTEEGSQMRHHQLHLQAV